MLFCEEYVLVTLTSLNRGLYCMMETSYHFSSVLERQGSLRENHCLSPALTLAHTSSQGDVCC